ncbi:hypothetical protein VNO78_26905 [Psophocarpus tetragonolobus]|uniref:Uncharacterized protein n=1 Tax=Psophocarpus tetragonolobus TaxID=3891 RepID=A0AAN9S0E9_PSOTE
MDLSPLHANQLHLVISHVPLSLSSTFVENNSPGLTTPPPLKEFAQARRSRTLSPESLQASPAAVHLCPVLPLLLLPLHVCILPLLLLCSICNDWSIPLCLNCVKSIAIDNFEYYVNSELCSSLLNLLEGQTECMTSSRLVIGLGLDLGAV